MRRLARGILAACALLAAGCILPTAGKRTGRPLGDAKRIVPGTTTKDDLFAWLGAPAAIAGAGEYVEVPAATVHHPDEVGRKSRWFGGGSWVQQGDAWLELFAARRQLHDGHRVYYWYTAEDGGLFVFALVAVISHGDSSGELWALVDETTGIVDDAVYRKRWSGVRTSESEPPRGIR